MQLPESVRLPLARLAVWRLRRGRIFKNIMLGLCLVLLSGASGFLLSQSTPAMGSRQIPILGAAQTSPEPQSSVVYRSSAEARQLGELQAEVLRLRLLFSRIVESADLGEAEFALAVQLADDSYMESLTSFEESPAAERQRFELVKRAVDHMTTQAGLILSVTQRRNEARRFTLSGSPVVRAQITSRFGYRPDPRSGRKRFHRGLDFGGHTGSKVLALADGVVTYSGQNGGYGNLIELEHVDGYRTRYAHNDSNLVEMGSKVSKGQVIATMGSTGHSTGAHVHVEVRSDGKAIDPLQFISTDS